MPKAFWLTKCLPKFCNWSRWHETYVDEQRDSAQATQTRQTPAIDDERVQANLHQLVRLQHYARNFSFLPRQPVHSLLAGRHASRIRGRGLNFEEIRQYRSGDDIRTIDWKVTARLRSPHTRVFTEERDRPALLVIDQRIGMFFGTQVFMKSVVAAQLAALAAWRIIDEGDRVGAIIFNDDEIDFIKPGRSRGKVMRILESIVRFNHQLSADSPLRPNPAQLENVLDQTCRIATHDFFVAIVSDFHGLQATSERALLKISQHNDLIGALVHDPVASKLPKSRDYVITDGELQIEVPNTANTLQRVYETSVGRMKNVLRLQTKLHCPVLPISTGEPVINQVQRLLGRQF